MRSINVPFENTGKKIKRIRYCKEHVSVYFFDNEKIDVPIDIYTSYFFYPNKVMKQEEIEEIELKIKTYKLLKYARSLLIKRRYSEKAIRQKLYLKEATKEEVDEIIKSLKDSHLIDDKSYVEDFVSEMKRRGYGKNKIILKLKEKGIFKENFEDIIFLEEEEVSRARSWIKKLEKKYQKYPYNARRRHIQSALTSQGFDLDVIEIAMKDMSSSNDKEEKELIKKDFKKIYEKYKKKYSDYELREKIYGALRNKGYSNRDITRILEEEL